MASENGNGTIVASRGRLPNIAAGMRDHASMLEAAGQGVMDQPLACEAYSECVAILRDGADRLLKPLRAED